MTYSTVSCKPACLVCRPLVIILTPPFQLFVTASIICSDFLPEYIKMYYKDATLETEHTTNHSNFRVVTLLTSLCTLSEFLSINIWTNTNFYHHTIFTIPHKSATSMFSSIYKEISLLITVRMKILSIRA